MREATLYAGPSAHGLAPALFEEAGVRMHPPVRRGDIDRLLARRDAPGALIVCDGIFQCVPAVSHAELGRALDAGWEVWGVSSIGAIRAWEMRDEGMRGFGEVYAMFSHFDDFTDDEMCQLHFPEPPWFPVSEPLVNVRHALATHGQQLAISDEASAELIARLRELWFGDRTPERIHRILEKDLAIEERRADEFLAVLTRRRVKTLDLERLLLWHPWNSPRDRPGTP